MRGLFGSRLERPASGPRATEPLIHQDMRFLMKPANVKQLVIGAVVVALCLVASFFYYMD